MNQSHFLGNTVYSFKNTGDIGPIEGVVVVVDSEHEYSAYLNEDKSGHVLTVECPRGTKKMAEDILAKVSGKVYRSFEATGARLPIETELGDSLVVNGTSAFLGYQQTRFSKSHMSDISAPGDNEVDHEYPYIGTAERTVQRVESELNRQKVTIDFINGITVEDDDGTTRIKGSEIETGSLKVKALNVSGEFNAADLALSGELLLGSPLSPAHLGYVGATTSLGSTYGVALMSLTKKNYAIATATGAKIVSESGGEKAELSCYGISETNYGINASLPITTDSDRRLKNSISYELDKYESFFDKLKPCVFRMNDGGDVYHIGFIAQDILNAENESGIGNDELSLVKKVYEHYAVAYSEMISLNTYMIQKVKSRIEELEKTILSQNDLIDSYENRLAKLEAMISGG